MCSKIQLLETFWHFFWEPESKNVHKTTKLGSYNHRGNLNQNVKTKKNWSHFGLFLSFLSTWEEKCENNGMSCFISFIGLIWSLKLFFGIKSWKTHPVAFAQFKEQKYLILCVFCRKNASTAKTKGDMKKCLCTNLFSIKFWFKGVIVWGSTINATPRSRRFLRHLLSKECFYSLN